MFEVNFITIPYPVPTPMFWTVYLCVGTFFYMTMSVKWFTRKFDVRLHKDASVWVLMAMHFYIMFLWPCVFSPINSRVGFWLDKLDGWTAKDKSDA